MTPISENAVSRAEFTQAFQDALPIGAKIYIKESNDDLTVAVKGSGGITETPGERQSVEEYIADAGVEIAPGGTFVSGGRLYKNNTGQPFEVPNNFPETFVSGIDEFSAEPTPATVLVLLGQSWATPPPPADIDPTGLKLSDGVTDAIIWEHDGIDPLIGGNFSAVSYGALTEYVRRYDNQVYPIGSQVGGSRFEQNGIDYVEPANPANNARHIYPSLAANWAALKARLGYTPEVLSVFVRTGAGDESTLKNPFEVSLRYLKTMQDLRELYESPELQFVFQLSYQGVKEIPYGDTFAPEGLLLGGPANSERQAKTILDFVQHFDQNTMVIKNAGVDGIISEDESPPQPDPSQIYAVSDAATAAVAVAAIAEGETFQMAGRLFRKESGAVASTSNPFDVPYDDCVYASDGLHQSRRQEVANGRAMMKGRLGDLAQLAFPSPVHWYVADRTDNELQRIRSVNESSIVVGVSSPAVAGENVVQHIQIPSAHSHRGGSILVMTRDADDMARVTIQESLNQQLDPPSFQNQEFENDQMRYLNGVDTLDLPGPYLYRFTAQPARNNWFVEKILNFRRFSFFDQRNLQTTYTDAEVVAASTLAFQSFPIPDEIMRQGRYKVSMSGRITNLVNPVILTINMINLNNAGNPTDWEKKLTIQPSEWFSIEHDYYMSPGDTIEITIDHTETNSFTIRDINLKIDEDA